MSTIVIGAGIGGLAAAAYLARAGQQVTILERATRIGGRAVTTHAQDFHLNLGPHALYRGGPAWRTLSELGISLPGGTPGTKHAYALDGDCLHALPSGPLSLLTTGLLTIREKMSAARALSELTRLAPEPWRGKPLSAWLEQASDHARVRTLLAALARLSTYCEAPALLDAADALGQVQMATTHGVQYLDGGWQAMVEALASTARAGGAVIRTAARAQAVYRGDQGIVVELAGSERMHADAVILAVDPRTAAALVPGFAAELVPVRAACLDVALTHLPEPRVRFAMGMDEPLYYSVHSSWAALAPEHGAVVHMAYYLPPGERAGDGARDLRLHLEARLDRLQPGWRNHVVEARFAPSLVVMHALPAAASRGVLGRPAVDSTGMEGVYLAGDWVGSEGLLADASLASGRAAAMRVIDAQAKRRQEAKAA